MMGRARGVVWIIFVAALALRVSWIGYRWLQRGAALDFSDEHVHWQLATNLANHGALVTEDGRYAARMPLYPLLLTPWAALGERGILAARLMQALAGAATAAIACALARRYFGLAAALCIGALVAADPFAVFFSNLLLSETVFTSMALGLVACACPLVLRPQPAQHAALAGVALLSAAAIFTRPSAVGWIVLLWLFAWLADRDRWRATRRVAACVLVLAAALLPWGARNKAVIGGYAWLSSNGGVTLYDAQGPQADGSSNQSFLREMWRDAWRPAPANELERDRALAQRAWRQMREKPVRVLRLAGIKFLRMWNLKPNVEEYRGGAAAPVSALYTLAALLLALAGTWRGWRPRGKPADAHAGVEMYADEDEPGGLSARQTRAYLGLVWLPVVYFTLLHCIYIGSLRYRMPLMPFLLLAGAVAIQTWFRGPRIGLAAATACLPRHPAE
jgi:hypothetical protein